MIVINYIDKKEDGLGTPCPNIVGKCMVGSRECASRCEHFYAINPYKNFVLCNFDKNIKKKSLNSKHKPIQYSASGEFEDLITPCPNRNNGTMVGSANCVNYCKHFHSEDKENKIVLCGFKTIKAIYLGI